jgi:NTP pyrophosphatase (non-canonical NTP hydrolase)
MQRKIPAHTLPVTSQADIVFRDMQSEVREYLTYNGWRNGDTRMAEYVALLHSEASEILEEWRNHNEAEMHLEFADVLIRLLDMCDLYGTNLALAYRAKMDRNWTRPYQHGGRTL